jgi:S1-C subfamily serine protease
VDEVNRIVPRLIRDGKFIRPALGIQAAPPQFSEVLGIKQGVAVLGVLPNSPAQAAGLRPFQRGPAGEIIAGDVITAIDGTEVENAESLLDLLERHQPGETVKVTVLRDGKSIDIPVTLGISG